MKKTVSIILASVLLVTLSAPALDQSAQAGFADDWLASTVGAGPDYAEGQKRGYMTGGSFSARWQPTTDPYLLSIQKPKISAGCGGIDIFMGGFSFLGFDYIVKKFQAILMNAPALAFDLALKTLAEQASTSIKSLDQIINMLNSLQQDDCAIASAAVNKFADTQTWQSGMSMAINAANTATGSINNWFQGSEKTVANKGEITAAETQKTVSGCGPEMKTLFLGQDPLSSNFQGALFLDRIGSSGRLNIPADYIPFIRGLVGDIMIGSAENGFKVTPVTRCAENSTTRIDDIVNGKAHRKAFTGECSASNDVNSNLYQFAMQRILGVRDAVKNKTSIDPDDWTFVKSTPFQVLEAVKIAVESNQEAAILPQVARLAANAMALQLLMDLNDRIDFAIRKGQVAFNVTSGAGAGSAPETCQVATIEGPVLEHLQLMQKSLSDMITAVGANYNANMTESQASFAFINQFQHVRSTLKKSVSKTFGAGFANRVM